MDEPEKKVARSVVLKVMTGIAAFAGIIWLVLRCPTCH